MTPNPEHIKRILCLHCERMVDLKQKESYDELSAIAFVLCDTGFGVFNKYLRTKCHRYKADCLKQPEPCNGDCEQCANRTEWQEWAE